VVGPWLLRASITAGIVAVTAGVFELLFHPQHLSFDSYHYMVLSFEPVLGNAHPIGFGALLRALRAVTERVPGGFAYAFQVWQVGCLAALVWVARLEGPFPWNLRPFSRRFALVLILASAGVMVLPLLIFLMNGYWSDMTSLLVVALAAVALHGAFSRNSRSSWAAFAVVCALGWYIRYQLVILPLAGALTAIVVGYDRRHLPSGRRAALVACLAAYAAIFASQRVVGLAMPTSNMASEHGGVFLQKSLQCRLRCSAKLHERDCSSEAGRAVMKSATCTAMLAETADLGRPVVDPKDKRATFERIGLVGALQWLAIAPLGYAAFEPFPFGLEHESFGFDRQIRILHVHERALAAYGALLPKVGAKPAPPFLAVVEYLRETYYESRWFQGLAQVTLLLACAIALRSRKPAAVFLALVCIGTHLVFAYLQPKAPLRYLAHIVVPGLLAGWLALLPREHRSAELPEHARSIAG
jgi:hypothetical protein